MQLHEHLDADAQAVAAEEIGLVEQVVDIGLQPEVHRMRSYAEAREISGGYEPRTELGISGRSQSLGREIIRLKTQFDRLYGTTGR